VHPDGLLVADDQGFLIYVNKQAAMIVGTPAAELLGQDIRTAIPLQENDGRSWWACADPWKGLAIRTGHREKLLIIPGRQEVLVTAKYVRTGRSMPVSQVVVALRDAEARRRAEANNSALISTVAHELRSPLTSVKGFSSTLLRRWDRFTDDQKRLMLQTIEADADRVTRLITELLDISRIDAGRLEVRKQPVDVVAAISRHIERFVASGHDRDKFALDGDATKLPEVWADPDRLDQILANLMENAVRHGDGIVSLKVVPTGRDGDEDVAVTVSDEGEGIAPEHYPMVFTRFWHGTRRGGTGLGLYVVRGLVEAHGGKISVGRATGGGAEFRFTLPAGVPEHNL
jgi:Osmosensitive K+ channel histidine kinase